MADKNVQPTQKVLQQYLAISLNDLVSWPFSSALLSQGKAWCLSMVTVDLWPSWLWP